jgi:hypothetical protein
VPEAWHCSELCDAGPNLWASAVEPTDRSIVATDRLDVSGRSMSDKANAKRKWTMLSLVGQRIFSHKDDPTLYPVRSIYCRTGFVGSHGRARIRFEDVVTG